MASTVNYTVKELLSQIHAKMEAHHDSYNEKLDEVIEQTTKTNGRVTKMEDNPFIKLGKKAQDNPFKFILGATVYLVGFLAVVISDFRHPILAWLIKLIGII